MQYIYQSLNNINNKKYLGSHTGNIDDKYYGSGKVIMRAIKKYGINNFSKEIIEIVPDNINLLQREQYWLDKLDCAKSKDYYNVSPIAGGGDLIKNMPLYKQNIIRKKQAKSRNKNTIQTVKKILNTRNRWTDTQKQEVSNKCSLASKARWKNMTSAEKKSLVQKIINTKANKTKKEKAKTSALHSTRTKKYWDNLSPEQKQQHIQKISISKTGHKVPQSLRNKIATSVTRYYQSLTNLQKVKRANKISKAISSRKWCNDGVHNYRLLPADIVSRSFQYGRI